MIFVIPWREFSLIGATDTDFNGDLERLHATGDEVAYLLGAGAQGPARPARRPDEVVYTYAGVRPLSFEKGKRESDVSRAHKVVAEERGRFLSITGTKLTCFRSLAEELGDQVLGTLGRRAASRSDRIALDGTDDEAPRTEAHAWLDVSGEVAATGLGRGTLETPRVGVRPRLDARARARRQGGRRHRAAVPLEPRHRGRAAPRGAGRDGGLAARRDAAAHGHRHQPLPGVRDCAESIGQRMAQLLGWTPRRLDAELEAYQAHVARSATSSGRNRRPSRPRVHSAAHLAPE